MAITRSNKGSIATSEIKAGQEPDKKPLTQSQPALLTTLILKLLRVFSKAPSLN
jgi:hypothetical protein